MSLLSIAVTILLGLVLLYIITRLRAAETYVLAQNTKKRGIELNNRKDILEKLTTTQFDILIIGGGITGSGCALDAASRGLKVAMIERYDFGSESSSKTTKLLHGGFRYLLKAFSDLSLSQVLLVIEGLNERKSIMRMAPYLTRTIKILVPIYNPFSLVFYYLIGQLYDWLSWSESLGRSFIISKYKTHTYYYNLKEKNLLYSMAYYDGMMQDARLNIMVAKTASSYGATISNYVEYNNFTKDEKENIITAECRDTLTGEVITIKTRMLISATGCFTDHVRKSKKKIIDPSSGTHIILDAQFGPEDVGLLDSETHDKRLAFILPWKGYKIVGATEVKATVIPTICPNKDDVDFLINEAQKFSKEKITMKNVKSAWSGIRPLVSSTQSKNTESIIRSYSVLDDGNGLISIAGGKYTMFRKMAEKGIDLAIKNYNLLPINKCITKQIMIVGSNNFSRDLYMEISKKLNIDIEYSKHLLNTYGTHAFKLKKYLEEYPSKLSDKYQFTAAEAIYCIEHEYACTSLDIINNRFELGFYDIAEAIKVKEKLDVILNEYFTKKGEKYIFDLVYSEKVLKSLGKGMIDGT